MHSLIFHVDVNSAFLSWESAKRLRDNPDALDLRTINAVIGARILSLFRRIMNYMLLPPENLSAFWKRLPR